MERVVAKELRISAVVAVPDDMFEQADLIAKVRPAIEALRESLPAGVVVSADLVNPRPREEGAAPKPRKRRNASDTALQAAQPAPEAVHGHHAPHAAAA